MTSPTPRSPRRTARRSDALSRERIVETAVEVLDAAGEGGLTFRVLTERLATGAGAIYWHVANKDELLAAATEAVVARALPLAPDGPPVPAAPDADRPREGVHAVALRLFEAAEAHPWLSAQIAAQLAGRPGGTVGPRIFEALGRHVRAMGVPVEGWFTAASALMHYVLGATALNAANTAAAHALDPGVDRPRVLADAADAWQGLDPAAYSFTRTVADQLREHDDHEQFRSGLDLVLAGIAAAHPPTATA
ncbi:TetR family transcriptional regulator [Kitasatospora sp. SolWspMP-SS2h]|uniref:TetR/AcrR family transcriptional regulator n=1 Tax=Kitasatospora sp. SolWspMP-SS2h TaxID=1305729 RepID=UPI000DBAA067|nr:TetR/AcrR family transcriptional regulator [Kitasatospora sp. SolWspMP-SS2h]RAJ47156.1 TetR family transcriptional regulator [Kitasatospora sp. SolWspMP-SS2h]